MDRVNRVAEQGGIAGGELVGEFGEGDELGGADRREVRRVAEEYEPPACVVGQPHRAVSGFGLEVRCLIADERQFGVGARGGLVGDGYRTDPSLRITDSDIS